MLCHEIEGGESGVPDFAFDEVLEPVGPLEPDGEVDFALDGVVHILHGIQDHDEQADHDGLQRRLVTLDECGKRYFGLGDLANLALSVVLAVAGKGRDASRRHHKGVDEVALEEFKVVDVLQVVAALHPFDGGAGTTLGEANDVVFGQADCLAEIRHLAGLGVVVELTGEDLGLVLHVLFGLVLRHVTGIDLHDQLFLAPQDTVHDD